MSGRVLPRPDLDPPRLRRPPASNRRDSVSNGIKRSINQNQARGTWGMWNVNGRAVCICTPESLIITETVLQASTLTAEMSRCSTSGCMFNTSILQPEPAGQPTGRQPSRARCENGRSPRGRELRWDNGSTAE